MSNVRQEAAAVQQSRKGGLKVEQARNVLSTDQQQSLPFRNFKMSVALHKLQFQDCMTGIP
jgi:hypothetical protein